MPGTALCTKTKTKTKNVFFSKKKKNHMLVDAFVVRWFEPRMITITVTSSWYFLLLPAGISINSFLLKPAVTKIYALDI